jgi:hypothetical protein
MKKLMLFSILFLSANYCEAKEFNKFECVDSDLGSVQKLFTRYSEYSTMKGSDYVINLGGAEFPMIRMIKSQSRELSKSETDSENFVWIVLQPSNLTDASLYPRFLLKCKTQLFETVFLQNCEIQKDKQKFGLNGMTINLVATHNHPACKSGQTALGIQIKTEINTNEVENIKLAVLKPAGPLAPLVAKLFNEESFFSSYFNHLYSAWIDAL